MNIWNTRDFEASLSNREANPWNQRFAVPLAGSQGTTNKLARTRAADPGLYIPAGVADYREDAVYLFANDSRIVSLLPHMHNRGKSMRYVLERPDGTDEVLLEVPAYDYNWQNIYRFREPVDAPAGSLMKVEAHWDNSEGNVENPDATIDVPWGDGTDNEMMVAFIGFIDAENVKPRPARASEQIGRLLSHHREEEAFLVSVEGMSFGGQWGLVVPEGPGGEGELYMYVGHLLISTTIHDVFAAGEDLVLNGGLITSGGGTRMPMGFLVRRSADGASVSGEVFFGRELTAENVEGLRGSGRGFEGVSGGLFGS